MPTESTPPTGRERRRKGPINRIRRFLYGALLLAAAPGAAPADELAYVGKFRTAPATTAVHQAALVVLQGLLVLRVNGERPDVVLDAVTAQLPDAGTGQAPQSSVSVARVGSGFDLPIEDLGDFRLLLAAQPSVALAAWSLAGSLEFFRAGGERLAVAVPELRVQGLHGRELRYLAFEAGVRRKTPEAALQLDFRWRI